MTTNYKILNILILTFLLVFSCQEKNKELNKIENTNAMAVIVMPDTTNMAVGGIQQLTHKIIPANTSDKTGVWNSTNESIAMVNSSGLVTGINNGICSIKFTSNNGFKTDSCVVRVKVSQEILPAFPNAYGAGADITGGRGGTVLHVTNLSNDNSPGSLRWALKQAYPRIIVFDVSGTIDLAGSREFINGSQYGDLTIAGQTAPEGGITLVNGTFVLQNMSNLIIRYIKCRGGSARDEWDSLRIFQSDNYIIDHCDFWYGTDEGLDTSDKTGPKDGNITVQNSLFCENKTGLIMGIAENDASNPSYGPVSVIRNMFVNVSHRFPKYAGEARVDVINNGVHNWRFRTMRFDGFAFELNEIGNYYQSGTNSTTSINTADGLNKVRTNVNTYRIHTSGNFLESSHASALGISHYESDNTLGWSNYVDSRSINSSVFIDKAFHLNGVAVPVLSSNDIKPHLLENVGARHYLNADGSVGEYLDDLQSTYLGYFENDANVSLLNYDSEYGKQATGVPNNVRPEGFYISNPHIPEIWFQANVPPGQGHNEIAPSGYTWLEEYLNMVDGKSLIDEVSPWCIIGFDSQDRTPGQRIALLNEMGFKKYGYNRGKGDLSTMIEEFKLSKENNIEIISVFLWLNADRDSIGELSPSNKELLNNLKKIDDKPTIWVSLSDNFFKDLDQQQSIELSFKMIEFIKGKANELGCKLALYNHHGWFGNPHNQVEIINRIGDGSITMVYNFHHAHDYIDEFPQIAKKITPFLSYVNLNGMKKRGPQILTLGEGEYELNMIKALIDEGYKGPWGILGHIKTEDVKNVLQRNMKGLNDLNLSLLKN
ncbi:Ig-like domain-containing protein [Winogradskyella sp. A2]|uniref:Ig-like domain-containing protein n=1 Tax=Winogradskyella sp. A2 TaxID=3366944 RepID=UPI00398C52BC